MTIGNIVHMRPGSEEMAEAIALQLTLREVITLERIEAGDMRGLSEADYRDLRAAKCISADDPPAITHLGTQVRRIARRIETAGTPSLF